MLSPEVWNLRTNKNTILVRSGIFDNKAKEYVERVICNHAFNQMVSIILPGCDTVPESIVSTLKDSDFYRVDDLDLSVFLNHDFVEGFVKKGKFTALSWNPRNDIDDCYAVTPSGKLILSIHKELYQSLGLEGERSVAIDSKNIIKIDLKHPDLIPGRSYFERIKKALSNEHFKNIAMQFAWDPPNLSICPSSVAKYFSNQNYTVNLCNIKMKMHTELSLKCPSFLPINSKDDDRPHELIEYIAMRMLTCNLEKNEFLNSYSESHDCDDISMAKFIHCKGFFTEQYISRLTEELKKVGCQPWVCICVQGFEYSLLSFFNKEHRIFSNGDNNYILLLHSDNQFLLYQNSSSCSK